MSSRYHLTDQELADVEFEHRHATGKRYLTGLRRFICQAKDGRSRRLHKSLQPYAPNLNLIEGYWRFFSKKKFCMAGIMKLLPCQASLR